MEQTKTLVQDCFRVITGLLLDMPRTGSGNTSDGNTARRSFDESEAVSEIPGINVDFLRSLKLLLELLNSGKNIDQENFSELCSRTAELYVSLYPWYPMSPTLHKILIHGPAILQNFVMRTQ